MGNADVAAVPRVVLGTMTFGDTTGPAEAARIIGTALDSGVTWFDTANVYAGGRSEEMLGDLVPDHPDLLIATKCGMPAADSSPGSGPLSPVAVRLAVESSLRRLKRERIDVLYLHGPDRATPLSSVLETVAALVSEGKVGAFGVSNFAAWQICALMREADELGAPRPVLSQQMYNMLARRIEEEYAEFAATAGLATVTYNPLAGGLLGGRYVSYSRPPNVGRFATSALAPAYRERYWQPRLLDAVRQLRELAEQAGISLLEMALRWVVGQPATSSVILGASSSQQLEDNLHTVARGPLSADLNERIDQVGRDLRGPMPAYNR